MHRHSCLASGVATLLFLALCQASSAAAVEPIVAGLDELVVFDPGKHERGLPAVELKDAGEGLTVDIPSCIHVHRFYYSGDKEFQGPLIAGGPTVVVANHPKTGKRMMVDVMLPPGAPRIAHNKSGITYVYKDKRVEVEFQCFPFDPDKVVVKHYSGRGMARNLHDARKQLSQSTKDRLAKSTFVDSTKEAATGAHDLLKGLTVASGDLAAKSADGAKSLANLIPGVVYVKSRSEQKAARGYGNSVRDAARELEREAPELVPTNR